MNHTKQYFFLNAIIWSKILLDLIFNQKWLYFPALVMYIYVQCRKWEMCEFHITRRFVLTNIWMQTRGASSHRHHCVPFLGLYRAAYNRYPSLLQGYIVSQLSLHFVAFQC